MGERVGKKALGGEERGKGDEKKGEVHVDIEGEINKKTSTQDATLSYHYSSYMYHIITSTTPGMQVRVVNS